MYRKFNASKRAHSLACLLATTSLWPLAAHAQQAGETIALPTVEVTATQGGPPQSPGEQAGYSAPPVQQSTTKLDVPTFNLPVAIATVPEQVIQDQNAISIQDALQNVSGVQTYTGLQSDQITNIRGFDSFKTYRDGLLIQGNNGVVTPFDTANLQNIEVLKGPASFLFGRTDPGGIINLVTKNPLDAPYYSVEQQGGSFNLLRTVWDLTGPVAVPGLDNGAVSYRFSGSYTNGGQFIDFVDNQNPFFAPAITWNIDPATTLTIDGEYNHRERQRFAGIPAIGMYPASLPVYRSFEEPNTPLSTYNDALIAEEFKHHFDDNWTVTSRFLAVRSYFQQTDLNAASFPAPPPNPPNTLLRPTLFQYGTATNYSTNLDLTGKFYVGDVKNDVLIGADYFSVNDTFILSDNGRFPINIFNPVYGTVPTSAFQEAGSLAFAGKASGFTLFDPHAEKDLGMYVQDLITPFEGLHVLLGTRYDFADVRDGAASTNFSTFPFTQPSLGQAFANFATRPIEHSQVPSPQFGLVYQPVPWIGFYGSYTRSFGLPNGINTNNTPLPPKSRWAGRAASRPSCSTRGSLRPSPFSTSRRAML